MDNSRLLLGRGLAALGLPLAAEDSLWTYGNLMLRWNERVNLTAITDPVGVIDKHLLDSLAVLQDVPPGPQTVLDLGAGAGLPGLPWAIVREDLDVTLVDAVQKKVAFMKTAIATLRLAQRARAIHLRASGAGDGLGRFQVVVSRAFMGVGEWLPLAAEFLAPGGVVLAMVGQSPPDDGRAEAARAGLVLTTARRFTLPISGDPRGVLVFRSSPATTHL